MEGDWKWRCFLEIETLDCPICTEPFSMPVYQCENGHPICSACSSKVRSKRCPSCSRPTGRIRCLALEKILESLLVPCKHGPHGCKEMLQYNKRDKRDDHEQQACKFRPFPCPLGLCSHEGSLATFSSHLADAHGVKRTQFHSEDVTPCASFRMSSRDSCMLIEVEKSANSGSNSDAHARDDSMLIVAHREDFYEMGDWFFCTVYGVKSVEYELKVKRADKKSESTMHAMQATVHDSARESVRAACGSVDHLLIPIAPKADSNLPRLFDVKVSVCSSQHPGFKLNASPPKVTESDDLTESDGLGLFSLFDL